jgi:hypothetical protein
MRHSTCELIDIAYRYYPRGVARTDPRYKETEEYFRLVAVRRRAGAEDDAWRGLLRRLEEKFPENNIVNGSLYLPTGNRDACYSGALCLPTSGPGEYFHDVGFLVSFLVPYYIVYGSHVVDDLTEPPPIDPSRDDFISVYYHNKRFYLPSRFADIVRPELMGSKQTLQPRRLDIFFEPSPDEVPYAAWLTREIEATFGGERMPPEIGKVLVPDVDVATSPRELGEATLYDCLFSDSYL